MNLVDHGSENAVLITCCLVAHVPEATTLFREWGPRSCRGLPFISAALLVHAPPNQHGVIVEAFFVPSFDLFPLAPSFSTYLLPVWFRLLGTWYAG